MALLLVAAALGLQFAQCVKVNMDTSNNAETCALLRNKQSHSTIAVDVGTPPQRLHLIADTGSSNVIVTHCACKEHGCYGYSSECFETEGNKSSTFAVDKVDGKAPSTQMSFGSGTIDGILASEVIHVGKMETHMHGTMIFMYDAALHGIQELEGILGLGLPYHGSMGSDVGASWLKQASVERFSMCFDDIFSDGVLRLNSPSQTTSQVMGSVGQLHWGLDFRGISVENDDVASVLFCSDADKTQDMETACGMIPDSGTTLIMGPDADIRKLYAKICDEWPRCADAFADTPLDQSKNNAGPKKLQDVIRDALGRLGINITIKPMLDPETQKLENKRQWFIDTLADCNTWANDTSDLDKEMPNIYLHVRGKEGKEQSLAIPASTYVVATGIGGDDVICIPFFGDMDYYAQKNGPVWVVGTPLFYEYEAHYDTSTTPPSMAFTKGSTCQCSDDLEAKSNLAQLNLAAKKNSPIRKYNEKVRMPKLKLDDPF